MEDLIFFFSHTNDILWSTSNYSTCLFGMQCSLILNAGNGNGFYFSSVFPQTSLNNCTMGNLFYFTCVGFCVFVPVYVHSNLFLIQVMSQARHSIVKRCFHLLASNMAVIQSNYTQRNRYRYAKRIDWTQNRKGRNKCWHWFKDTHS